jgi:hypothetical protein
MAVFSQLDGINNPIWYKNPRKPRKLRWHPFFFYKNFYPSHLNTLQSPFEDLFFYRRYMSTKVWDKPRPKNLGKPKTNKNKKNYASVKAQADKKFGTGTSLVKNMWISKKLS